MFCALPKPEPKGEGKSLSPNHERPQEARAKGVCPRCGQGVLDYDGTLNLICPVCGVVEGGCFT